LVGGELWVRACAARDSYFSIRIGAADEWDRYRTFRLRKSYAIGGVTTNSKGILGPEFEAKKAPGSFRIVALGDSCTFIPAERNYPRVLEELLREARPDAQIDVINASCPGYRSDQARTWYERDIDGYEHDLLIIYLGWNDMSNPQMRRIPVIPEPSSFRRLVARSQLLRYLSYLRQGSSRNRPVSLAALRPDQAREFYASVYPIYFEENLLAVIRRAKSRGRQVCLLNYATLLTPAPTKDEQNRMHFPVWMDRRLHLFLISIDAHQAAIQRVAKEADVPIIDIKSLFRDVEDRRVFTDSTHYNEHGAEIIAARVAEVIEPYLEQRMRGQTEGQ
jgi:lysophospholipase L1-like esterase